jgi:hypothetical protein
MIGDTITLPLSSGNVVCNKINQDGYSAEYLYATSTYEYRVRVRHTKTGPKASGLTYDRHTFDVTKTTFASGATPESYQKFYFVMEQLPGTTDVILADGVADYVIASSNALVTKLNGWES